jgi:hypothetical protein
MNVFRNEYRPLTEQEKAHIAAIKTTAEILYSSLHSGEARHMALAKTKLEECVMWATKAITG